jgi:hypothetical protein
LTRIPVGQVHSGAVLECVTHRVQHIRLNPKWVAGFARPSADTGWRGNGFVCFTLSDHPSGCVRIDSFRSTDAPYGIALLPLLVTLIEREPVRNLFDRISVGIDLEFVHAFRMVAGNCGLSQRVADIDCKYGARLAAEYVEIGDVKANVLPSDG